MNPLNYMLRPLAHHVAVAAVSAFANVYPSAAVLECSCVVTRGARATTSMRRCPVHGRWDEDA